VNFNFHRTNAQGSGSGMYWTSDRTQNNLALNNNTFFVDGNLTLTGNLTGSGTIVATGNISLGKASYFLGIPYNIKPVTIANTSGQNLNIIAGGNLNGTWFKFTPTSGTPTFIGLWYAGGEINLTRTIIPSGYSQDYEIDGALIALGGGNVNMWILRNFFNFDILGDQFFENDRVITVRNWHEVEAD
jgi:hypothetical protein